MPDWITHALSYWKEIGGGALGTADIVARIAKPRLWLSKQDDPRDGGLIGIQYYYQGSGDLAVEAPAKYIRVEVFNSGGTADGVSVMVDAVRHNGAQTPTRRSALHWEGEKNQSRFHEPITLRRGRKNRRGVDVCKVDLVDRRLQLLSQASEDGYDKFDAFGMYEIDVLAECSNGIASRGTLTLEYDASEVAPRLECVGWKRWWLS